MQKKITFLSLSIVLIIFIVIGYLTMSSNNKTILKDTKRTTNKQNNNYLSMMLETSAGSSEYEEASSSTWPEAGYTFNDVLSKCEQGSKITWDNTNNKVIVKGSKSDRCYVYFDMVPSKYWNDGFVGDNYIYPNTSSTIYANVAELRDGYGSSNFASAPIYIKTSTEHQACLYYNNKEFCLGANYWIGDTQDGIDGSSTKIKLQRKMAEALGISESSLNCNSYSNSTYCTVSGFGCTVRPNGNDDCGNGNYFCTVYNTGYAHCM